MPGLEKNDVFRLRCIIAGAKVYKELLTDYMNYRGLEAELLELREKVCGIFKEDPRRSAQINYLRSALGFVSKLSPLSQSGLAKLRR